MTPEETETIIRYDLSSDTATIYSCQRGVWLKLERYGYLPTTIQRDNNDRIISKEFKVPKRVISLRSGKKRCGTPAFSLK